MTSVAIVEFGRQSPNYTQDMATAEHQDTAVSTLVNREEAVAAKPCQTFTMTPNPSMVYAIRNNGTD